MRAVTALLLATVSSAALGGGTPPPPGGTEFDAVSDDARADLIATSDYERIDTKQISGTTLCGCDPDAWYAGTDLADAVFLHVTSTDDDEEDSPTPTVGTIRWALRTETLADGTTPITGARVIVFDVSGTCAVNEILRVVADNVYIAGQTAPVAGGGSGGFTITGRPLKIEGSNVRVDHLRVRPGEVEILGSAPTQDGITIDVAGGVSDIYLKNCSVSHSIDEIISCRPGADSAMNQRISVVDCILAEPLKNPTLRHEDDHNFGMYFRRGSQLVEFSRNIVGATRRRSPAFEQKTSSFVASNYTYDNGSGSPLIFLVKGPTGDEALPFDAGQGQHEILCSAIHNVYVRGAEDAAVGYNPDGDYCEPQLEPDAKWVADPGNGPVRLYQAHNYVRPTVSGTYALEPRNDTTEWQIILDQPSMWGRAQIIPYDLVQAFTLTYAGAWPGDRDACDTRIVAAITAGTLTAPSAPPADAATPTASATWSEPASAFTAAANGRLVIENTLEALHVALGGWPNSFVGQDVLGTNGGLIKLQSNGDVEFDPAGDFDDLYDDETRDTQIVVADIDGSNADTLTITVAGATAAPTPDDSSTLRGLYTLGSTGFALDFLTGEAARGSTDISLTRQVENLGRGQRTYVDDLGDLIETPGLRINGDGLLMTSLYLNPRGPSGESEQFTFGGTNWYTTFFDREQQSVDDPLGNQPTVHCSIDRDSRATMTTNDYDLPGTGKAVLSVWLKRGPEVTTGDNVYVPLCETSSDEALAGGGNGRRQYWVGPVTDEWQWFHVVIDDDGNSDKSVGFSRDCTSIGATDYRGASAPAFVSDTTTTGSDQLCRFFYAWGYEVRYQDTIPNCYAGRDGAYPDRLRLTGDALAQATALKDACTITVIGVGGGGNADILSEDGEDGCRIGFVSGQIALKSAAGNVLSGVTPAADDTWTVVVTLNGTDASIQVFLEAGADGSLVSGTSNVTARTGPLYNVARQEWRTGEEMDMAIERIVMEPL